MLKIRNSSLSADDRGTMEAIMGAYRAMDKRLNELLARDGLTRPQFLALKAVAENGRTPMNKISDCMSVTPSNVTGIIDRLVSNGFLRRGEREGDRRKIMMELTGKGASLYNKVYSSYEEFLESILHQMTLKERQEIKKHLVKLEKAITNADL
jgi:DNA-binding MarR family transcriptional regulator